MFSTSAVWHGRHIWARCRGSNAFKVDGRDMLTVKLHTVTDGVKPFVDAAAMTRTETSDPGNLFNAGYD